VGKFYHSTLTALILLVSAPTAYASSTLDVAMADYRLGYYTVAKNRFEELAVKDDPEALFWLGTIWQKGLGVTQNYEKAAQLFQRSALNDNADAQNNLGLLYRDGKGHEKSFTTALAWFTLASEKNHRTAENNRQRLEDRLDRADKAASQVVLAKLKREILDHKLNKAKLVRIAAKQSTSPIASQTVSKPAKSVSETKASVITKVPEPIAAPTVPVTSPKPSKKIVAPKVPLAPKNERTAIRPEIKSKGDAMPKDVSKPQVAVREPIKLAKLPKADVDFRENPLAEHAAPKNPIPAVVWDKPTVTKDFGEERDLREKKRNSADSQIAKLNSFRGVPKAQQMPEPANPVASVSVSRKEIPIEKKPYVAATQSARSYMVQIGIFRNLSNVRNVEKKLSLLGERVSQRKLNIRGVKMQQLRIGPYASLKEARTKSREINTKLQVKSLIIKAADKG